MLAALKNYIRESSLRLSSAMSSVDAAVERAEELEPLQRSTFFIDTGLVTADKRPPLADIMVNTVPPDMTAHQAVEYFARDAKSNEELQSKYSVFFFFEID